MSALQATVASSDSSALFYWLTVSDLSVQRSAQLVAVFIIIIIIIIIIIFLLLLLLLLL